MLLSQPIARENHKDNLSNTWKRRRRLVNGYKNLSLSVFGYNACQATVDSKSENSGTTQRTQEIPHTPHAIPRFFPTPISLGNKISNRPNFLIQRYATHRTFQNFKGFFKTHHFLLSSQIQFKKLPEVLIPFSTIRVLIPLGKTVSRKYGR